MAAPTNTSAATAIDITSLPYSVTQDVHDAGVTYEVWYKFTAAEDAVVGLWGFGDVTVFKPTTRTYVTNPAGFVYQTVINKPSYFAVNTGLTYYFKFTPNAGNPTPANLIISLLKQDPQTAPAGSIGVMDTVSTYPIALLDRDTDFTVLRYALHVNNGDYGAATIADGRTMLGRGAGGLYLYDGQFNLIAHVFPARACYWIASNDVDTFYASTGWPFSTGNATVYKLDHDGALTGDTWTLDQVDVRGLAVSPDESILYYIAQFDVDKNKPVRRWDLVNDVVLSNLAAGINTDTYLTSNLVCLGDGSVLVGYRNDVALTQFIRQYSAAGAVVRTFSLTYEATTGEQDLLAYDVDDTSFWYWQHGDGTMGAANRFTQFRVADGVVLRTVIGAAFDAGRYNYTETATPLARFGNPYSCPFWITREAIPSGGATGTIRVVKVVYPTGDPTEFTFTAGGGLSPTSFTLVGGGDAQVFNGVPVGSGYSIVETADPDFHDAKYDVSNDSSYLNISVAADETVVVTVTNCRTIMPDFEIVEDPRRWLRRAPIVSTQNRRVIHDLFVLDVQSGESLASGAIEATDAQCVMRFSDDSGRTWSNELWRSMGRIGKYATRLEWWRLGDSRFRVYEVSGNSPTKIVLLGGWVQARPTTDSPQD